MKLIELNKEELLEINGGSEASDAFWFFVGVLCKPMENTRMRDEYGQ